jgi:secreted Zn-dependent insulinase-like peptidase
MSILLMLCTLRVYYCITAQSRLFAKFLETILEPRLYDATLVGYSYSIESYPHGLMLSFSGPASRMSQLISTVVSGDGMVKILVCVLY